MRDKTVRPEAIVPALILALVGALALAPALAAAPARGAEERIGRWVFAPELVMSHQAEIGLTAGQRDEFVRRMQKTQSDLVPLKLELSEAVESLVHLLTAPRVDEAAALEEASRVMRLEAEVKRRHLELLIGIKNMLSEEQQMRLRRIRAAGRR